MKQPSRVEPQTIEDSPLARAQDAVKAYTAAWERALAGGSEPDPELILAPLTEVERLVVRPELIRVDRDYMERLAERNKAYQGEATHFGESEAARPTPSPGPEGTLEFTPPSSPPAVDSQATVDPDPTIQPGGAVLSDATVDPEAGKLLQTGIMGGAPLTQMHDTLRDTKGPGKQPGAGGATLDFDLGVDTSGGTVDFSVGVPTGVRKPLSGPTVPGYDILGELGRGGMGVVYKARQKRLNRMVALKMVLAGAHASPLQLARFHTEAEAVAHIQHPNIVQIYEIGDHDGLPYFSLEFVEGGSLADQLEGKPQPPRKAALLLEQLARAMQVAHEHGIIHRDLKPANILIGVDGSPKITDFGLAKKLEDDAGQTRSGTLMGTPSYMAPEQARGDNKLIGPLSDVYSLGSILYEVLTGRPPLQGATVLETLEQVRKREPLPVRQLQPRVPRDLDTITLKCLQKEPHRRYGSAAELADDVRRFLNNEPIRARPVGRVERVWRWCRRNPRVATLSSVVALLVLTLVGSLGTLTVRSARETRAHEQAIGETRQLAEPRLEQAKQVIWTGDARRALALLDWSTPQLDSAPELDDLRVDWQRLRSQVQLFAQFRTLLDNARFASRFGSRKLKERAQGECRKLVELDQQIKQRVGKGIDGLPPLGPDQEQRFREDVCEAYLIAAMLETDLVPKTNGVIPPDAARRAIDWYNRAEEVLPGMRVIYANRCACWGALGNKEADEADKKRALATQPTNVLDRLHHAFAERIRAEEARRRGDAREAEKLFRKEAEDYADLLRLRPDYFWGYFNWANAQVDLNNLGGALVGYTTCIHLQPDFPWPYNNRGTIYHRLSDNELAIKDYTTALTLQSDYLEAYASRGLAYARLKNFDAALADLDKAAQLDPEYPPIFEYRAEVHRERKQYAEALADYSRLLELKRDREKAPVYNLRAAVYHDLGQDSQAIADCTHALDLDQGNPQYLCARAYYEGENKEYAHARDDYTVVLSRYPGAYDQRFARAVINWRFLKDFEAALADCEELNRQRPKDPEPYRIRGVIYLGLRRYDDARLALLKAVEYKPDSAEALWALAQLSAWQGDTRGALELLDPLIQKIPAYGNETLNVRGDIYRSLQRYDEAAADYQRLIGLQPDLLETYVSLALVYEKQGKPEAAKQCYDKMIAANAASARPYLLRAVFRRAHGEYDAARKDCALARERDKDPVLPGLVEASLLAVEGKADDAVAQAAKLLSQAPAKDGHVLYAAACVWSLASRSATQPEKAKQYADRAAALLRQCLDKGFHDLIFPEHNHMAYDPALDPIRQRPDVRGLLTHRGEGS